MDRLLIFSYFEVEDIHLHLKSDLLLHANLKRLVRFAQKSLPSGISDAAIIRIERQWIASTLPNWELLKATNYIYARLFECCNSLAKHLQQPLSSSIRPPNSLEATREVSRHVRYFKLNGLASLSLQTETARRDEKFEPPQALLDIIQGNNGPREGEATFAEIFELLCRMAVGTFNSYGNHVPMLHLFDSSWKTIDLLSTHFNDQAEKYIFWRHVADKIRNMKAHGLIWTCESWVRKIERGHSTPTRNLDIIGEHLRVVGVSKTGEYMERAWKIARDSQSPPRLELDTNDTSTRSVDGSWNFLRPAIDALTNPDGHRSGESST